MKGRIHIHINITSFPVIRFKYYLSHRHQKSMEVVLIVPTLVVPIRKLSGPCETILVCTGNRDSCMNCQPGGRVILGNGTQE